MKRIMVWLVSLVMGLIVTFILFEFTGINIPFIQGRGFTLITVLLLACFFSYILDTALKAGVYDERGAHLGLPAFGAVQLQEEKRPSDYQPIVSREARLKQEQKQSTDSPVRRASRH